MAGGEMQIKKVGKPMMSRTKVLQIVACLFVLCQTTCENLRTLERWTGTTAGLIKLRRHLPSRSSLAESVES
jgi:hypothetical protein